MTAAFARTVARYRGCGRFAHGYVRIKLRRDPVHAALFGLAMREPFGSVLDLGCGRSQLGITLLEAGLAATVLAVDRNARHLRQAARAAVGLALRTELRDLARPQVLPTAATVVIVDLLYQLDTPAQMRLLEAAARAAEARVLIRTADPDLGLQSQLTRWVELLGRRVWPHSGACVNAQPLASLAAVLGDAGFATEAAPCRQGMPFANVLLIGRRRGPAPEAVSLTPLALQRPDHHAEIGLVMREQGGGVAALHEGGG
jgi:SAM-dependent methyltransferase